MKKVERTPLTMAQIEQSLLNAGHKPFYKDESGLIYCGDCLDVMKGIPDGAVDLVVTDPPYKLSQEYTSSTDSDNLLAVASIYPSSAELKRIVKPGGWAVVIYDNRILPLALAAFRNAGWKYVRALTLYRRAGSAYNMCGWMSTSDLILLFQNGAGPMTFYGTCSHDVYIKDKLETVSANHPAQKPLWIMVDILQRLMSEDSIILDPFAGSGTTCVAAKQLGRRYIGIEISEDYCAIARERLRQGELFNNREAG